MQFTILVLYWAFVRFETENEEKLCLRCYPFIDASSNVHLLFYKWWGTQVWHTKLRQQNIDFTGEFGKGDDDSHDEKLFKLGGCQL